MEKEKKLTALYVLKVLIQNSDEKHPISQTSIKKKLEEFGINCDRKTISRNIDYLIEFGYDIVKISGGGCYLIDDKYDSSEIAFLVDCIFSSPAISQKQALSLIDRITSGMSVYEKQKYKNIYKSNELIRTDNKQIFYNIDQINNAIESNKQISFIYNKYGKDKTLVPRREKEIVMNPYFTVNSKGKYFLVCNRDGFENLANYRIDYMTQVKVLDTDRRSIKEVCKKDKINPVDYANEHIYMFSGETLEFTLKIYDDRMINEVIDWFGKGVKIYTDNDDVYVKLKTNENALIYWALQYGESVEIVAPQHIRDVIKEKLNVISKKYE